MYMYALELIQIVLSNYLNLILIFMVKINFSYDKILSLMLVALLLHAKNWLISVWDMMNLNENLQTNNMFSQLKKNLIFSDFYDDESTNP